MNKAVIKVLAKSRVNFEAKLGNVITLEDAIAIETKRLGRLQKDDNYRY
tara:strand:- start:899 stop:1045 length:147 start_codon:yes stop_codon:yes gene_type:complete